MASYPPINMAGFSMPNFGMDDGPSMGFTPQISTGLSGIGTDITGKGLGGFGGGPDLTKFGFNFPTAQASLGLIGGINNIWNSIQANKRANQMFQFQKDYANTNLRNQTQSYNTQMADRINSRAFVQGMSPDQANAYLNQNRLQLPPSAGGHL